MNRMRSPSTFQHAGLNGLFDAVGLGRGFSQQRERRLCECGDGEEGAPGDGRKHGEALPHRLGERLRDWQALAEWLRTSPLERLGELEREEGVPARDLVEGLPSRLRETHGQV